MSLASTSRTSGAPPYVCIRSCKEGEWAVNAAISPAASHITIPMAYTTKKPTKIKCHRVERTFFVEVRTRPLKSNNHTDQAIAPITRIVIAPPSPPLTPTSDARARSGMAMTSPGRKRNCLPRAAKSIAARAAATRIGRRMINGPSPSVR